MNYILVIAYSCKLGHEFDCCLVLIRMKQRNYKKWFCRFERYEMIQRRIDDVYIVLGSVLFHEKIL
jgi:hypothetical protein